MPRLTKESVGGSNYGWLDSTHGIRNGRTGIVNVSAFTAGTHYPNGFIPAGTPVAAVSGKLVPYDSLEATTTNAGVLAGHLAADVAVPAGSTADQAGSVISHGRVKTASVPVGVQAFVAPVAAAKRINVTIVYI